MLLVYVYELSHVYVRLKSDPDSCQPVICFISQLAVIVTLFLCHWLNSNNIVLYKYMQNLSFDSSSTGIENIELKKTSEGHSLVETASNRPYIQLSKYC